MKVADLEVTSKPSEFITVVPPINAPIIPEVSKSEISIPQPGALPAPPSTTIPIIPVVSPELKPQTAVIDVVEVIIPQPGADVVVPLTTNGTANGHVNGNGAAPTSLLPVHSGIDTIPEILTPIDESKASETKPKPTEPTTTTATEHQKSASEKKASPPPSTTTTAAAPTPPVTPQRKSSTWSRRSSSISKKAFPTSSPNGKSPGTPPAEGDVNGSIGPRKKKTSFIHKLKHAFD